jgi:nucleoside-diphosphate-sugar epimerase
MKVLITGTTGLLGGHLIQELQRHELGYEPEVDIREGIRLAAAWFNAGGMEQPFVIQASQYAPLGGVRKS